jgi:hypothetical protein
MLTYSGDLTFMTIVSMDYTVTVANVLNPPSIMPLTYNIITNFNYIKSGTYSASYAISQPYTLSMDQMASSNSTYGQVTNLTLKLANGFYYAFDELKLYVPKENYKSFSSLNNANSTSGVYTMTENATHFLIQKIYSTSAIISLQLANALNTSVASKIAAEMYVQGYLSSKGLFSLPSIQPVYLYATVSSSNRYIGENTSLTFDVRRVNNFSQEQKVVIFFNNTVISIGSTNQLFTADPTSSQLYSYNESVSSWTNNTKLLSLQYLQNIKFIPNLQTLSAMPKLNISTFDQFNSIVATTLVDISSIVPNSTRNSISYSFTRTSNESLNNTDIIVDFVPRYPEIAKLLKIELPIN